MRPQAPRVRACRCLRGSGHAARGLRCAVRAPRRARERTPSRETKLRNARDDLSDETRDLPRRSTYHRVAATEMPDGSAKMARSDEKVGLRKEKSPCQRGESGESRETSLTRWRRCRAPLARCPDPWATTQRQTGLNYQSSTRNPQSADEQSAYSRGNSRSLRTKSEDGRAMACAARSNTVTTNA